MNVLYLKIRLKPFRAALTNAITFGLCFAGITLAGAGGERELICDLQFQNGSYFLEPKPEYRALGVFVGREVPGMFNVDLQIRHLSLRAITETKQSAR